ncbi:ATPase, T2SS/T4P/T4SS family, partial [Rhizobium johnstonii]
MRREPSLRRSAWITTSTEVEMISRTVFAGSVKPPMAIISGGTGSGKTTLLNCITNYIDRD